MKSNDMQSVRRPPDRTIPAPRSGLKVAHITTIDMSLRYLLLNQLKSIQRAGYQVVGISAAGPDVPVIEGAGVHHFAVQMTRNVTPATDLKSLWRLYRLMRRERFTIVHCHTPKAELLGQVAARLAGVPIVVDTFRGIYYRQDMHPLWRRLFIGMARIAADRADVILSQSREAMKMAIEEGICPPEKVRFLGNGIDVKRFDRSSINQATLSRKRRELGISPEIPVIGFVGRLVREKGILELLRATRIVQRSLPDAKLLVIGPLDSEKPDAVTPRLAQEFGLSDVCIFTGLRFDLPELYALMDVFVLPSHRESFPRSPMEAAAMGIPCIVTDIPGCREVVDHDRNGLLVSLGNVQALAEAIQALLIDTDRSSRMGQAARQMAVERFDEQLVFSMVKDEYARLLQVKGLSIPLPKPQPAVL